MLTPSVPGILQDILGNNPVTINIINTHGPVNLAGPSSTFNTTLDFGHKIQVINQHDPLLAEFIQKLACDPHAKEEAEKLAENVSGFAQSDNKEKIRWYNKIIDGAIKLHDIKETLGSAKELVTPVINQLHSFLSSNGFPLPPFIS